MKVLVTGGSGFIGKHLINDLLKENHEVVILDKKINQKQKESCKTYEVDISTDISQIFIQEKPDIVLHLAAQTMLRYSIENPIEDAMSNIIGSIQVLEACRKANVKRLVYTSTGGARYGDQVKLPADESQATFPDSPYGISKHSAEHYIQIYTKQHDIDSTIICFGNVYGPGDDPKCGRVVTVFIDKILRNQEPFIFGDGLQTRDFVYVKDLTSFITKIMKKPSKSLLYNISSGIQTSVLEIYKTIKELIDTPIEAIHKEAIKGEIRDIVLDITKAKEELNWDPKTSIRDGIKESIEDIKQNQS